MTSFGEKSGQNLSGRKERETESDWKIKRIFAITASPWLPALGVETQDCTSQGELKVQNYHKIFEKYVAFVKIFKFMFIIALNQFIYWKQYLLGGKSRWFLYTLHNDDALTHTLSPCPLCLSQSFISSYICFPLVVFSLPLSIWE